MGPYGSLIIHSFRLFSVAPLQVHNYSEALPNTARILCRNFTPKRHRQLRVKDLPKVRRPIRGGQSGIPTR